MFKIGAVPLIKTNRCFKKSRYVNGELFKDWAQHDTIVKLRNVKHRNQLISVQLNLELYQIFKGAFSRLRPFLATKSEYVEYVEFNGDLHFFRF